MFKSLLRLTLRSIAKTKLRNVIWPFLPNGVYVFNYHRIGDSAATEYDQDVFSCSRAVFYQQLLTLKQHFTVINNEALLSIINQPEINQRYALITFDDGYIDSYTEAFPIMREAGVSGVFFLPTGLMGGTDIPWWDEMAFILRNNIGKKAYLPEVKKPFLLEQPSIGKVIKQFIYQSKRLSDYSVLQVLDHLRQQFPEVAAQFKLPRAPLFMDWEQVAELVDNGMEVGSHTISHQILSQLSDNEQRVEIAESKIAIERHLTSKVSALSYPVGRAHCYTDETKRITQESGYLLGFNHQPAINQSPIDPYDIYRFSVNEDELSSVLLNSFAITKP